MKMPALGILRHALTATALLGTIGTAAAEAPFPSRPITIVVGYAAGGQADAIARAVATRLSERLKNPVIVDNKPGGNAMIAAGDVAKAEPDGHTLLFVTDAMTTIEPQLAGPKKVDVTASFDPIINMAFGPLILAAANNVPVKSLSELVEYGKKNPETLNFGTSGNTTPHRITGELLQQEAGFKMTHVAYKGTSASVTDLAGGHIELVIGAASALKPLADAGKIKLLAVTSEQRLPVLPNVPAIAETYKGFNMVTFLGLMAPKSTPKDVVTRLNSEINEILAAPAERQSLEQQGMLVAGGSPADFAKQISADYEARGKIIHELKLSVD
jgi:tripartite-type tricarboxylate transporter receptor subunit TctC